MPHRTAVAGARSAAGHTGCIAGRTRARLGARRWSSSVPRSLALHERRPRTERSPRARLAGQHVAQSFTRAPTWRQHATVASVDSAGQGPIAEYDRRVESGVLRNDDHQRSLIQSLQDLHEMLAHYEAPTVLKPDPSSLTQTKPSFLASIFGRKPTQPSTILLPSKTPKGLYMYGDVGSGKTMLMDLFFDTLPPNIRRKTRIHFHNFMQETHKALHKVRMAHGNSVDGLPIIAADIASRSTVLCFDEFQVTDIADAMILRRLVEAIMAHGTVIVTTSNRHPRELYKNGIQRESFVPCIKLLQTQLSVLNLDSQTDYRKIPRPPSGVYHHPLDKAARTHAEKWFAFLGDVKNDPPHAATQNVWGRQITVPEASGRCARFTFEELIGKATGAADYIELMRSYDAFVVTDVPSMTLRERDWARRFITFIDAVYESRAKLVLTTAVPLQQLFLSKEDLQTLSEIDSSERAANGRDGGDAEESTRMLMEDLGLSMEKLKKSSIFSGDEEAFAFARALSRLTEMGSVEWVERGMGLERKGGKMERDSWQRVRSRWREDSM